MTSLLPNFIHIPFINFVPHKHSKDKLYFNNSLPLNISSSYNLNLKSNDIDSKSKSNILQTKKDNKSTNDNLTTSNHEQLFNAFLKAVKSAEKDYLPERHGDLLQYLILSLKPYLLRANVFSVNKVLNSLKSPSFSLQFFRWAQTNTDFKSNTHVYTNLINRFGKAKDFDKIEMLLNEMKNEKCEMNDVTYTTLIKCYAEASSINKAIHFYTEMKAAMIKPSIFTYSIFLSVLTKKRMYEKAITVYEDMKQSGVKGNCIFYTNVITMYGSMGDLTKVYETYELMHEENVLPNVWTYNYLFHLYGKVEQKSMVIKLFEKMKQSNIMPDTVTYNTILYLHHSDSVDDVYGVLLDELASFGLCANPDAYSYTVSMIACVRSGNFQEVARLFEEMDEKKLIDGSVPYNIMLSALLAQKKFDDVERLIEQMRFNGVEFNLETYICLLQSCIDFNGQDSISMWMKLMEKSNLRIHNLLQILVSSEGEGTVEWDLVWSKAKVYIESIIHEPAKQKFAFSCTLVHLLNKLNLHRFSARIWQEFKVHRVFNDDYIVIDSEKWFLDLHEMSTETAVTVLTVELNEFKTFELIPKRAILVTGKGKHSKVKTASVKFKVVQYLNDLNSPFRICKSNSGVLEACGEDLMQWMQHPSVSSMLNFDRDLDFLIS